MTSKLPKGLTTEEFKKFIIAIKPKDKTFKVASLLAYGSGLRISEVINLKKENIRTDTKPPMINILEAKGGKDRQVPIPKGWRDWMINYIPIGKGMRALQQNFVRIRDKLGLNPEYSFHSYRHGFALRLIESGVPINQVQLLMGHANISTTSIYTRARPSDALKSYDDLF